MSQADHKKTYEVRRVGGHWLIGTPGNRFQRVQIIANAEKVVVSETFLIVDEDVIYEIEEGEHGKVILVKVREASVHDEQNWPGSHDPNASVKSDQSTSFMVSSEETTDGDLRALDELEMGHTDYDSLEAGNTEETSLIEIISDRNAEKNSEGPNSRQSMFKITESHLKHRDTPSRLKRDQKKQPKPGVSGNSSVSHNRSGSNWNKSFPKYTENVFETKEKITVKVYSADILSVPVDCIVSAANINLDHGGGIARAIVKAAGKDLTKDGCEYLKTHGKLQVGEACSTSAGKMNYNYVVHAVGPCWRDYKPYTLRDVEKFETDLYNAVINSLCEAEKKNMQTVAVSSISSGKYGCPLDLCSVQYARAVLDYSYLANLPLKEIHFVDTNMEMVQTIQATFQSMIPDGKVPKSYNKLKYVVSLGIGATKMTATEQSVMSQGNKPAIAGDKPKPVIFRLESKHPKSFDHSHDTRLSNDSHRNSTNSPQPFHNKQNQRKSTRKQYDKDTYMSEKDRAHYSYPSKSNREYLPSEEETVPSYRQSVSVEASRFVEQDESGESDDDDIETCFICMEDITKPKRLPCGHTFCSDCIAGQFTYKEACPTCGKVYGIIKCDQPEGTMNVYINKAACCVGYEHCDRIEIAYRFPDGIQESYHPVPGKRYKGISRTAYLPSNKQGKRICEMLKVAFERKLVFTIGSSRTTGAEGVITWNDIHHKTDPKPNTQFGYPDPTYLDRVTEELEVKGVTEKDIPTPSAPRKRNRRR